MDLLDAYARQVVSYYPDKSREDLYAETYDDLCEEFSDWQVDHPEGSAADFLESTKEHPMRYATRLAEGSQPYLIGPRFYYSFISALKVGVSVTTGAFLVLAFILALMSGEYVRTFFGVLWGLPGSLIWVCAATLGVFVALERSGERASWLDRWSARDLKPARGRLPISRAETFFDLGLSTFLLLWVLGVIHPTLPVRQDGQWISSATLQLPDGFLWLAAALLLFDVGFSAYRLFRSHWSGALRVITIAGNFVWFLLLAWVISQPQLVSVGTSAGADPAALQALLNTVLRGFLAGLCAILVVDALVHAWRWINRR